MAATCGRYTQTVPLEPDESYELGGLRQRRGGQALLHRNLVTEQAGDVLFAGVGHVGIRALADFVNLIPLALMKLLSPGLSLPDLPRSVCVAVTNAARPWRARWSAVILPGRQRRSDLAQQGSHQCRQQLPLFRNRRRLMLVGAEHLAVDSRSSSSCLAPSEVVELGGILPEDESARDAKKAPNGRYG
jgi:hypothetical protein